jgi:hypothetical protein
MSFVTGDQSSTEFQSGIGDPLLFVMNRPFVIARLVTPVTLTPGVFTSLVFDEVLNGDGDLLSGVKEDGVYAGYAFVRTTALYGNKNIRAQLNGGMTDTDSDPFAGDDNNTGSQDVAKGARTTSFAEAMVVGDFMDIGLFIDDDETTTPQAINGRIYLAWQHNA